MNTRMLLVGAALAGSLSTSLVADVLEIDLGRFRFAGEMNDYAYEGDYGAFLGTDYEGDPHVRTVATVDLGGLMEAMGGRTIAWIRVEDEGDNFYNNAHPGPDIDLFAVAGLPTGVSTTYSYEGINPIYTGMSSEDLAIETARVDFRFNETDESPWWVSLDRNGSLTMTFDGWQPPGGGGDDSSDDGSSDDNDADSGDDGGVIDAPGDLDTGTWIPPFHDEGDGGLIEPSWSFDDLQLRFNEISPSPEWTRISIGFASSSSFTPVPGPGALGVLGLALRLRGRRR